MKSAGHFNINDYMENLYEAEEAQEAKTAGGVKGDNGEGLIIPAENKKSYDWLKKEYKKGQVEVKVEMKMGGSDFKPGLDMQATSKSAENFKPGMYGAGGKDSDSTTKTPEGGLGTSIKSEGSPKKSEKKEDVADDKPSKKSAGVQVKGAMTSPKKKKEKEESDDE
jgi:hypothetical protein